MKTLLCLVFAALLTGCATQKTPQRYAWVTGLKPEKADYYRQLHAEPWPAVNKMIKQCHIQNFSIHERELDGKLYLFAYLEYTGKDFKGDLARMKEKKVMQDWLKVTDPMQNPIALRKPDEWWMQMKPIFRLD